MAHYVAGDGEWFLVPDPEDEILAQQARIRAAESQARALAEEAAARQLQERLQAAAAAAPVTGGQSLQSEIVQNIPQSISQDVYNQSDYLRTSGGGEEGGAATTEIIPVTRDLGGNLQGTYNPITGQLQNIYYKDQSQGGYWNASGQFIPYQNSGFSLGDFLGGMTTGVGNLLTSDAVKVLAPAIITGGLGGASGVSNMLGVNPVVGGAIAGGGTAALTGGDVLKGALMGSLSGAGSTTIGDSGVTISDVFKAANIAKNLESGNLLGAVTGAANIANAGSIPVGDTGFTLGELAKDANLASLVISGNPNAIIRAIGTVANSVMANATNVPTEAETAANNADFINSLAQYEVPSTPAAQAQDAYTPETRGDWNEITGEFVPDPNGGTTYGQINPTTSGNPDNMKDWAFDPASGKWAWTDPATGETTNYEYATPITGGPLTGKQIEDKAGAGVGGTSGSGSISAPKTPTATTPTTPSGLKIPAPVRAPAATGATTPAAPAANTAALSTILTSLLANQQPSYMPSIGDVAHIKSNESLFGALPGMETPASSAQETSFDPLTAYQSQYEDQQYASGGHVDDFSVDALLHILRS